MIADLDKALRESETYRALAPRVLAFFEGDEARAWEWWTSLNPTLGGVSPWQLVLLGKGERLRREVERAFEANLRHVLTNDALARD